MTSSGVEVDMQHSDTGDTNDTNDTSDTDRH